MDWNGTLGDQPLLVPLSERLDYKTSNEGFISHCMLVLSLINGNSTVQDILDFSRVYIIKNIINIWITEFEF